MTRRATLAVLLLLSAGASSAAEEQDDVSAFKLRTHAKDVKASIDTKEVFEGTRLREPRDAIPAIWDPESIPAAQATGLAPEDEVLGVVVGKEARAYPIKVLDHHEMVNDVLGGRPIAPNY